MCTAKEKRALPRLARQRKSKELLSMDNRKGVARMPKLPKSWRPQPTKEEIFRDTWATTNKIIRKAMVEQGVKYDKTLGEMIGLEKHMVSKSMNLKRPWTFCELCDIVSALKIPGEDAARMLGIGR